MKLYRSNSDIVETFQFLGIKFVSIYPRENTLQISSRCKKVINVMGYLRLVDWGGNIMSLIYVALFRSRLDYGSVVYGEI